MRILRDIFLLAEQKEQTFDRVESKISVTRSEFLVCRTDSACCFANACQTDLQTSGFKIPMVDHFQSGTDSKDLGGLLIVHAWNQGIDSLWYLLPAPSDVNCSRMTI